jgi:hypothetical protein
MGNARGASHLVSGRTSGVVVKETLNVGWEVELNKKLASIFDGKCGWGKEVYEAEVKVVSAYDRLMDELRKDSTVRMSEGRPEAPFHFMGLMFHELRRNLETWNASLSIGEIEIDLQHTWKAAMDGSIGNR